MAANHMSEWTAERIERFCELWPDPSLSCAEIGRRLGVSKSAVTGKRSRLGLPGRGSPLPPAGSGARPHQYRRAGAVTLPKPGPAPPPEPAPPRLRLPSGKCQFISGDVRRRGWRFCGETVDKIGSPWCAEHKRVVNQPRSAMRAEVV
jgi:hypothetical protein